MNGLKYTAALSAGFVAILAAAAANPEHAVAVARAHHEEHGPRIVREFADLLSIPNDAADTENINANAAAIAAQFADRGFRMELLRHENAPPLIYGRRNIRGAKRTIAIYVHYDGQPTEDANWTNPPFEPALYTDRIPAGGRRIDFPADGESIGHDWRLYARSAADDKAPISALLAALDALEAASIKQTSNIVLVFDGEEERGSAHLDDYLATHKKKFRDVDLWLFCDGPTHQSGRPQLVFGARGITGLDITVYGPNRGLHSGHYGNWAPGPGWRLTRLLASMKDDNGRVLVDGFYDTAEQLSVADYAAIANMPDVDDALRAEFGLAESEANNAPLAERIMLPALNLKGLKSAEVGAAARNVIPPTATAAIGIRLVKGNDPQAMQALVENHIAAEGYHIVRDDPDTETRQTYPLIAKVTRKGGYRAVRTSLEEPAAAALIEALRHAGGEALIINPGLGGTLPLYLFEDISDAPILILPIANFDNNQHAADENIRLGNLFYGIEAYAAILTME